MLARLLQLASPTLPVGAYTYSQGLEWAVEAGVVHDEASALRWIGDLLEWTVGRYEAPVVAHMADAWRKGDHLAVNDLDAAYLASRESAELRAETVQMGYSMRRLLHEWEGFPGEMLAVLDALPTPAFVTAWTAAATAWDIPVRETLTAWLWSWAENQTLAALKAVPLGQTAGQRLLRELGGRLPELVESAISSDATTWSNFAPAFAIASCRHETQYCRLFRS